MSSIRANVVRHMHCIPPIRCILFLVSLMSLRRCEFGATFAARGACDRAVRVRCRASPRVAFVHVPRLRSPTT